MENSLVSVLMTSYNRERFIGEAIESVLNSDYQFFELIIVDDRSADNTVSVARRYAEKDKRIRLYINEKNIGDYPNRNRAASYACGKYLMFCDSDDMYFKESISYCVKCMADNPSANIGFYHDLKGNNSVLLSSSFVIHKHFFENPILNIGPGGIIMNRKFFFENGCFPEKYGPANDMFFNIQMASKTDVLLLPKLFLNYRIHENQEKNNHFAYLYHNYNYLKDALKELPLPLTEKQKRWLSKKNKRRFLVNIIRYYLKSGNMTKTKEAIDRTNFRFIDALQGVFH